MKYDWENSVTEDLLARIDNLVFTETGLTLAGLAVANGDVGEAALIHSTICEDQGVTEADYRQDILGDAARQYSHSVESILGGENAGD